MRFLISAGEASGEVYGAQLIEALRARAPGSQFFGLGGERMRAAGFRAVVEAKNIAVVGLSEVVGRIPNIYREFRKLLRAVDAERPDAAILIDFPDFNFRLARHLHRRGIPVIYYVSPQLWAWRPGRIRLVQKYVRKMLVIFPFEQQFYRERGVDAEYVGHPLLNASAPVSREDFAALHGLETCREFVALLPGSRPKEVSMNLPIILEAAKLLAPERVLSISGRRESAGYSFVLPVASTLNPHRVAKLVRKSGLDVTLTMDARSTLAHARAAVVASGTATVEAALAGTPFLMVYRVSPLTWAVGRRLVKLSRFAMVNLIAGREVVPELVQADFTANNVAARLQKILVDGPAREQMKSGLAEVREKLAGPPGRTAAENAARAILAVLG